LNHFFKRNFWSDGSRQHAGAGYERKRLREREQGRRSRNEAQASFHSSCSIRYCVG